MCVGKLKTSNRKLFCKAVAKPCGKGFFLQFFWFKSVFFQAYNYRYMHNKKHNILCLKKISHTIYCEYVGFFLTKKNGCVII